MALNIILHQTHYKIGDFSSVFNDIKENINTASLHLYPEMFLTGYPLKDLCVQKLFINEYESFFKNLQEWCLSLKKDPKTVMLLGGLKYFYDPDGLPRIIENGIYKLTPGEKLEFIYAKKLLPNYDIFDEKKYFTPGKITTILDYDDKKFGLMICEDMWTSHHHERNPRKELSDYIQEHQITLDGVINLSASPFTLNKHQKRKERAAEIISHLKCPFYYVNRVGAEDDILFDGGSFCLNAQYELTHQADFYRAQEIVIVEDNDKEILEIVSYKEMKELKNSWFDLFSPRLDESGRLQPLSDDQCEKIYQALTFGLQDYAVKNGFKKFTIALSGGIDSALTLTLAKLSLKEGQELEAIYMPSIYSSALSRDLSVELCENLGINLKHFPIKFLHSATNNAFMQNLMKPLEGLADENVQSRLRGLLLYSRSNQTGSMVINTSNKSEIAVGYSTLYGDSVGALSLLGDLYKSDVTNLCHYLNKKFDSIIPEALINRAPTAELKADQTDDQTLPPYLILDSILEGLLSYRLSPEDLIKNGFEEKDVNLVAKLYKNSEYKRYQFPPILKVAPKSFGFGYRIPISKM